MSEEWKTNRHMARDLANLLHRRRSALGNTVGEAEIDAALASDDPVAELRILSVREQERNMLMLALARVEAVERDLKQRERTIARNRERAARGPSGIIMS